MKVTVDGVAAELKHGESLLDAVKKLELDSISLRKRPLAAQIGGEVFSLRYTRTCIFCAMGKKRAAAFMNVRCSSS